MRDASGGCVHFRCLVVFLRLISETWWRRARAPTPSPRAPIWRRSHVDGRIFLAHRRLAECDRPPAAARPWLPDGSSAGESGVTCAPSHAAFSCFCPIFSTTLWPAVLFCSFLLRAVVEAAFVRATHYSPVASFLALSCDSRPSGWLLGTRKAGEASPCRRATRRARRR